MNEESVQTVMGYFNELKEQRLSATSMHLRQMNLQASAQKSNGPGVGVGLSNLPQPNLGGGLPMMSFNDRGETIGKVSSAMVDSAGASNHMFT